MCAKGGIKGSFQRELNGRGSLVAGDHLVGKEADTKGLTDDADALTIVDVWSRLKRIYLSRPSPLTIHTLTTQVILKLQLITCVSQETHR